MADAVVNAMVQNLPRLLMQEINLHYQVKADIESLIDQLGFLQAFLRATEAQGKRNKNEIVREVMRQIRDALYKAEDAIDTYVYYARRNRLEKMLRFFDHTTMLHDVAFKIKNITLKIEQIKKNQQDFGVKFDQSDDGNDAADRVRERRRSVEEDNVVGFEKHATEVIKKLTERRPQRVAISIVGMGGLGKTTLARKIYKNPGLKRYFDICAWTNVSKDVHAKGILVSLLNHLGSLDVSLEEMETNDLKRKLRERLRRRKYLVVLDDIWDPNDWDEMRDAFPDDEYGSRLLITSRSNEVANQASGSLVNQYHLPFLTKEDSWELFTKKAFGGDECPPDLERLGRQIAESCDGLPLSIVVIAGLLAQRGRSTAEWSLVAGNENWHLFRQKAECSKILALSYDYLPQRLKSCFLYVGMYPEDFKIPARQLIRLWVAEGLIQEGTGNKQPEDVAEFYLMELIDRNLIQVASRRADGGVKTCRVHDLLRELCIDESKEDKFYEVHTGFGNSTLTEPRRLSLCSGTSCYQSSSLSAHHSSVRSLICFDQAVWDDDRFICDSMLKVFKLIRVLDTGVAKVRYLPESRIKRTIHLRYIRIDKHVLGRYFIDAFFYLPNLETLDVRGINPQLYDMNSRISTLQRLRHFILKSCHMRMPNLNAPLENLQSFCAAALEDYTGVLFSKGMFPKLRKLALCYERILRWNPNKFWPSLGCLTDLQTLKIIGTTRLQTEPHVFPSRLTKITLANFAELDPEAMPLLGAIPSLETLKLSGDPRNIDSGFDIDCQNGEFKALKAFVMRGARCRNWNLATGAMPRLQRLVIDKCKVLNSLPDELWSLANLEDVQVLWPSKPLGDMLRQQEMKDGCRLTLIFPVGHEAD